MRIALTDFIRQLRGENDPQFGQLLDAGESEGLGVLREGDHRVAILIQHVIGTQFKFLESSGNEIKLLVRLEQLNLDKYFQGCHWGVVHGINKPVKIGGRE